MVGMEKDPYEFQQKGWSTKNPRNGNNSTCETTIAVQGIVSLQAKCMGLLLLYVPCMLRYVMPVTRTAELMFRHRPLPTESQ